MSELAEHYAQKAPFPYAGGKSQAAPAVWAALGDVEHYCEPFFGTGAVLLNRPHKCNRTYSSEAVNDLDGLLVNVWRGIQLKPQETAEAASNPVCEADLHARHIALVKWRANNNLEHLCGDPLWCDPVMAGWWLWGCCCWIGGQWCSGTGAWTVDAETGRIVKQPKSGRGVARKRPFLSNNGRGVNAPQLREPSVKRKRPHLTTNGMGVNHADMREPGVKRQIPHLANNGMGVNASQLREPGVNRRRPHLTTNGMGVNHADMREPGVKRQRPSLANNGMGVNAPQLREPGTEYENEYHPVTMPKLRVWFDWLSARLRHVRILNGDWKRLVTTGATKTLTVRMGDGHGHAGIFLDPPYADTAGRDMHLYACDSGNVAHEVREWALAHGDDPDLRIVVAGFDGEHGDAFSRAGWREVQWFAKGFLRGGYALRGENGTQQGRERLYCSPHCLTDEPVAPEQEAFDF